ncbi:TRAP transporter large permease [Aquidulcibacter sp.]|jgi:C4-dicarboxylate transporter DctM subunit|uniref:TRAP transporter large permease n=1 Tax=Aquidulcibacter sp. TaxID=2052990 RepID=UPI0025C39A3C|nr:TRAP transporter large permease [Aquidulcibacter sp.]MCA3390663.1 TRAP transporter large permease [Roseomonas sp.]MCA3694014.1 TRAP transporter large permease [Aquidulcibacter sp.]MCA3775050.1 TRAP transporter large permease [Cutibacterium sp.]
MSAFAICIITLIGLSVLGLPIGLAMITASILYLAASGQDMSLAAEQLLNGLNGSYVLLAVPLFIFSAALMNAGSMTDRLLRFCNLLVGRFRGGLGHVNVVQSVIFSGMSGSAIADAAGSGKLIIDMMRRGNAYTASYAAAITAATAVIGPIIPPSIPMVLYALISDASIGYLFLGGVIPGLLMATAQMGVNTWMAHRHGFPIAERVPLRELPRLTWDALPALLMPVILLGGIYGGVMTPTEAAAVAAAYAFLVAALLYRSLSLREAYGTVLESARSTAAIGMLIAGALAFNYVVASENIPTTVRSLLAGYELSQWQFLLAVNILLLVLGCLLEGSTILLVVVPVLIPTAQALGIDMVHFGVVVVVNIMIGLVTPPYGLLLFIVAKLSDSSIGAVTRDSLPFILVMIVSLAAITAIPDLVLWLPRQFGYQG